jgi:hypothetical protein
VPHDEATPRYGDALEELRVGPLLVRVKYNCLRRDLYDVTLDGPFPPGLSAVLGGGPAGEARALHVIDVPGVHRLTLAPAAGRIVVMPKLNTERADQRAAVLALCERITALLVSGEPR